MLKLPDMTRFMNEQFGCYFSFRDINRIANSARVSANRHEIVAFFHANLRIIQAVTVNFFEFSNFSACQAAPKRFNADRRFYGTDSSRANHQRCICRRLKENLSEAAAPIFEGVTDISLKQIAKSAHKFLTAFHYVIVYTDRCTLNTVTKGFNGVFRMIICPRRSVFY